MEWDLNCNFSFHSLKLQSLNCTYWFTTRNLIPLCCNEVMGLSLARATCIFLSLRHLVELGSRVYQLKDCFSPWPLQIMSAYFLDGSFFPYFGQPNANLERHIMIICSRTFLLCKFSQNDHACLSDLQRFYLELLWTSL